MELGMLVLLVVLVLVLVLVSASASVSVSVSVLLSVLMSHTEVESNRLDKLEDTQTEVRSRWN